MSYQEKGGVGTVGRDLLRTDALTGGKPKETKLRFDKEEALDYAEEIKNDPDSFVDLYRIKVNNPSNYSLPRMMNLGLTISF